jgi:hypothetical protein
MSSAKHLADYISASNLLKEISHASLENFSGKLSERSIAKLRQHLNDPHYSPTRALRTLRATRIRFR